MAAKFGQAWCEKGFHITALEAGGYITYDSPLIPRSEPCRHCVKVYEEDSFPAFAPNDEVQAIARRAAERWRGTLEILAQY